MEYEIQEWDGVERLWRAASAACGDLEAVQEALGDLRGEFSANRYRLVRVQPATHVLRLADRRASEFAEGGPGIYVSTPGDGGLSLLGRAHHFGTAAEAERAIRGLTAGTGPLPGERLAVEEVFEAAPAERAWPGEDGA